MFRVLIFSFLISIFISSSSFAAKVEIEVHNIGQGNCILVKAEQSDKKPRYMLVDIGTAAYKKEFIYNKRISPLKKDVSESDSFLSSSSSPTVPKSTVKDAYPHNDVKSSEQAWGESGESEEIEKNDKFFITQLRKKLQNNEKEFKKIKTPPIYVQTVVITHPDTDHYNWLTKLFSEKDDHIDRIIFGGLPENYDISGDLNFKSWISDRLKKKSKIYFPAIKKKPIKTLEEVLLSEERTYVKHRYTDPNNKSVFKKAFDFGEGIDVFCLSANPTHFKGKRNTILRMSDIKDDNTDSIVLKIQCGGSSAILTGDATSLTTKRILDNYYDNKDFLKTNVLLASHHGSWSHGSNNEEWIKATQPEFIITSNGLSQGHPHDGAYQSFKKSPRLKKVTKHKMLVAESKKEWFMHETQNAIFSTLTNGTMSIVLEEGKEVVLTSEKQKTIKILRKYRTGNEDEVESIDIQENEYNIIVSPSPRKEQQKKGEQIKNKIAIAKKDRKKLKFPSEDSSIETFNKNKKRKNKEENSESSKKSKKEKFFTYIFEGEKIQFREKEVPYDGDCGYSALDTNRKVATELLLKNIHRKVIRNLIAPEIYDMLPQLPDNHPVVQLKSYQLNLSQQDIIAGPYQRICNRLNNLLDRQEGERWDGDQLWDYCQKNLISIQENPQKNQAYETLKSLREQIQRNEEERMQFCSQQKTVECYIKTFMQIPVHSYYEKYGDNNWLNYCPILMNDGKYRTYVINAMAYLLNKNLVIIHESGELRHKYKFSGAPMILDNTLFLRHIGNYHFNTLVPSGEEDK